MLSWARPHSKLGVQEWNRINKAPALISYWETGNKEVSTFKDKIILDSEKYNEGSKNKSMQ